MRQIWDKSYAMYVHYTNTKMKPAKATVSVVLQSRTARVRMVIRFYKVYVYHAVLQTGGLERHVRAQRKCDGGIRAGIRLRLRDRLAEILKSQRYCQFIAYDESEANFSEFLRTPQTSGSVMQRGRLAVSTGFKSVTLSVSVSDTSH